MLASINSIILLASTASVDVSSAPKGFPSRGGSKQGDFPDFSTKREKPIDAFTVFMMLKHIFGSDLTHPFQFQPTMVPKALNYCFVGVLRCSVHLRMIGSGQPDFDFHQFCQYSPEHRDEQFVRHDTGMGNTVCIWKWVCSGTGIVTGLAYPGNTIPFSMVLQVFGGMPVLAFQSGELLSTVQD
jgi:hypothetical protein